MKATLNTRTLARLLAIVGKAAAMDLVKLEASGGRFSAMCFNGVSGFSGAIQAVSLDMWTAHVSLSTLIALLGTLDTESVDLELTEKNLVILAHPARMEIRLSGEELPGIPAVSGETLILTGKQFQTIANLPVFASTDLVRPILSGIHVRAGESGMLAEAADSFVLGRVQVPGKFAPLDVLLPAHYVKETGKIIKPDDQFEFTSSKSHALITLQRDGENFAFATSLIDGAFPEVEQIIPKTSKAEVTLADAHILTFVRRAEALKMGGEKLAVLLHMRPVPEARLRAFCQVGGGNNISGTTVDEIPVKSGNGPEEKVALDPHYIRLACEFIAAPATLKVVADNAPVVLTAEDRLVVIMPLLSEGIRPDLYQEGIPVSLPAVVKTEAPVAA